MYNVGKWVFQRRNLFITFNIRYLSSTEVATALRPFYFSVHPDLFGQYPNQRSTNENSLKQLSSCIESLQSKKTSVPCRLQFYIRNKANPSTFRLINIYLNEKDVRATVLKVLKSCDLPTDYVEKIPVSTSHPLLFTDMKIKNDKHTGFSNLDENDPVFSAFILKQQIKETKDMYTLERWLGKNYLIALEYSKAQESLREEIKRLRNLLSSKLGLKDIRWDCGWNEQHFRGCLQSLQVMMEQHPDRMVVLKGRILVFAPFTGLSLDGHIMLNSGEIRHNWLDLIKNVKKYDEVLLKIPGFEMAVSQVLLGIRVVRRKFMPKILVGEYEKNLQQLTTNISDYLSRRSYPSQWPTSLNNYEIVVETESGPLMVSPTGQFITPSSCPGFLLVNFITSNLNEAAARMADYERNKHVERALHHQCMNEFRLMALCKDDIVSPDLMIQCCEHLLEYKDKLKHFAGVRLNICNYYSVLTDGTVCIPWNWRI